MGRNVKKGLDYFPFDVDFFQDIKIRKLIKYQRGKAVTVYALLLCLIYKNGYYMLWDEELPFILSEQTGFEEAYIQEVVKCCLALGLFSKELFDKEKVLTSIGIQERYKRICDDCRRKCEFSEFNLISSEDKRISSEEKPKNSAESTQIKEKEIKEKDNIKESIKEKSEPAKRFRPPTFEEVQSYIQEKGYSVDAEAFIAFYESKGWMVGKNKMRDWRMAVVTWSKRDNIRPARKASVTKKCNDEWI